MARVKILAQSDYSLQITITSEATVANFFNYKKSEFRVFIKHCFLMGKILFKQSNGFLFKCYSDSSVGNNG